MNQAINIIFPHQLFENNPLLNNGNEVYLIEEYLFFKQYKFHKQKIAFHRASMKYYEDYLKAEGITVHYIPSGHELSDIRNFGKEIIAKGISRIHIINPTDNWLEKRLNRLVEDTACTFEVLDNPQFLNTKDELLTSFFKPTKKSFFQTTFYKQQRKKRNILMDMGDNPLGGKWTYDVDNRKKYPKDKIPPAVHFPQSSSYWEEAVQYVAQHFADHYGKVTKNRIYPITHEESKAWLDQFLSYRFYDFGAYEDAIVREQIILNHSVLSPLINAGLILPQEVLDKSLAFAETENIPINSTEGFVRQIIGWREFIRGMYISKGTFSRTQNYWNFTRTIPASFYDGTTGIPPIDVTIKKVLDTGYCHHIERLMVLGNFMLLCEFHPDEVYRWFMELFIDAYDWVMVPNIYGMSQFADGGTFATKPYIGGSNYLKKMSNYKKGEWQQIWDGLFWRFIHEQQDFFSSNHRMSMMVHSYRKMEETKRNLHLQHANQFLDSLS